MGFIRRNIFPFTTAGNDFASIITKDIILLL